MHKKLSTALEQNSTVTMSLQKRLPLHADWLQRRPHRWRLKKATMFVLCRARIDRKSGSNRNCDTTVSPPPVPD
jgi:hypothetical protein